MVGVVTGSGSFTSKRKTSVASSRRLLVIKEGLFLLISSLFKANSLSLAASSVLEIADRRLKASVSR